MGDRRAPFLGQGLSGKTTGFHNLHALDELICICRIWVRALEGTGQVSIVLSCGAALDGPLHPGWRKAGADPMLTTLDLRAAYKQFALSAKSRAWSIIALLDPVKLVPGLFESKALPFGSSASVLELCLPWCNFYDDFPVMSADCCEHHGYNDCPL